MSVIGQSTGVVNHSIGEQGPQPAKLTIRGKDNYGKPRQEFADRMVGYTDEEFVRIVDRYVWLSAYEDNNPRSDYHWMCDATYDEAQRRYAPDLYDQGWRNASGKM